MAVQVNVLEDAGYEALVERAALRFRSSGPTAYYFCRGKLGGDPVFPALLRDGHIEAAARIVDLGCGQGVLAALLAAASNGTSPRWTLRGFDLRSGAIAAATRALRDLESRVQFEVGDIRTLDVPECDVVVILDVLHYIDRQAQQLVLTRVHRALAADGRLLLRIADAASGWRFALTLAGDWIVTASRGTIQRRFWCRPVSEWVALLQTIGFDVRLQPMSDGTPFANVLLIATKK